MRPALCTVYAVKSEAKPNMSDSFLKQNTSIYANHSPLMRLKIKNRDARRLWLDSQGLAIAPIGPLNLLQTIKDLGFVQLDSIRNVTRAHHHILWSRNQNYREPMLWKLLAEERALFEHFTHDASLIPMIITRCGHVNFRASRKRSQGHGMLALT